MGNLYAIYYKQDGKRWLGLSPTPNLMDINDLYKVDNKAIARRMARERKATFVDHGK